MKYFLFLMAFFGNVTLHAASAYNCSILTQTDVGATVVSTQVLAKDSMRRCLIIQNHGSSTVYLKIGGAHTTTEGFQLSAGSTTPVNFIFGNSIYAKAFNGLGSDVLTIITGD